MSWSQSAFEDLARLLSAHTGLAFSADNGTGAELRIRRAMAAAGVDSLAQYHRLIETEPAALDDLLAELTIGETYFYREPAQFQMIRRTVIPEIRRRGGPDHVIRAWSAGCASGEEAYSLAMVFAEEGLAEQSYLLATDISRSALAKARRGVYGAWSLRGEGAEAVRPYLHRRGRHYTVDEALRRRVVFEYLNLALDEYPSFVTGTWGMDLILCRNVLIYFNRETIQAVARRLFASLAEGGWLITASSDPPLADEAPFEVVVTDAGLFYRRGARPVSSEQETRTAASSGRSETSTGTLALEPAAAVTPAAIGSAPVAASAAARPLLARALQPRPSREDEATTIRSLANRDLAEAERACAAATARQPLSSELHYLWSVLLLNLGRDREAQREARRAIYLDRSLAVAHFTLGAILQRRGDRLGAWRAYRNARDLCAARPSDEVVPLTDGETAGRLAAAAEAQMTWLHTLRSNAP